MPKDPRDMTMTEALRATVKSMADMSLNEHIDIMLRAKLMTPEEAAEIRGRMPAEKLTAPFPVPIKRRPAKRKRAARPDTPPAPAAAETTP